MSALEIMHRDLKP